ncbi:MAG: DUF1987 domain-containing protein [Candidatus Kapabacteria bacterium]|nr:DUF1987 domain-containing protein [Candidatus Kapabacteria bacterium]
MENLFIESSKKTPLINFDCKSGVCQLKGRSIPEDTFNFYQPVISWISDYVQIPLPVTQIKMELDYFNTSSSKFLLELFKKFKEVKEYNTDYSLQVEWYYEDGDEEIKEIGEDFKEILNLDIKFIEI